MEYSSLKMKRILETPPPSVNLTHSKFPSQLSAYDNISGGVRNASKDTLSRQSETSTEGEITFQMDKMEKIRPLQYCMMLDSPSNEIDICMIEDENQQQQSNNNKLTVEIDPQNSDVKVIKNSSINENSRRRLPEITTTNFPETIITGAQNADSIQSLSNAIKYLENTTACQKTEICTLRKRIQEHENNVLANQARSRKNSKKQANLQHPSSACSRRIDELIKASNVYR